ncbi:hypothetical protein INR49_011032 [Caranx melampygus]|nr:hypothetical protein INR49_011032 [Caranx melampygus]
MTSVKFTVAFMIIYICLRVETVEIVGRNISCSDMKTTQGFKFLHECPNGANISAFFNKVKLVKEKWVTFTATEAHEPDPRTPHGLWIGVGTVAVALIIIGILVGCCYHCWKNNMTDVTTAASDPQGSDESGPVQNGTAVVHSGDTNGHVDGAMRRFKKDDPGGRNGVMVTDARSGCVRGDHGDRGGGEDHEAESSLLLNERANIPDPDMAGEAEAFVKKSGFDPGQVSKCFAISDVESPSQNEETQ